MNRTERDALGRINVQLPAIPSGDFVARLELIDSTGSAIAEMVRRFDELPSRHPARIGNGETTALKVVELAKRSTESGDITALLCLAGFDSWIWVDNDAGMPRWRALHDLGALDLRLAIEAAFFAEITTGHRRPARALVEMVDELSLAARARTVLDECSSRGQEQLAAWAASRLPY